MCDDQFVNNFQIDQVVFQNFGVFVLKTLCLGMAIFARSAGTRSGPTLMGRILPGPIRNRVGYGFPKKNPKRVRVGFGFFLKNPNPTLFLIGSGKIRPIRVGPDRVPADRVKIAIPN